MLFAHCSLPFAGRLLLFARCSLLSARCSLLFARSLLGRGEYLTIQRLRATAQQLVTSISFIYLVDEFFIFSLLVLVKEMRDAV